MCIASDGPKSPYQFTPRNTTVQFCGFLSCAHIRSCSVNDQLADMPGVSPGFCWGKWLEVVGGIKVILHLLLCRLLTGLVVCAMAQGTYKAHKERNYFLDKHSSRAEAATAITFIPRALKKEKDKKKIENLRLVGHSPSRCFLTMTGSVYHTKCNPTMFHSTLILCTGITRRWKATSYKGWCKPRLFGQWGRLVYESHNFSVNPSLQLELQQWPSH